MFTGGWDIWIYKEVKYQSNHFLTCYDVHSRNLEPQSRQCYATKGLFAYSSSRSVVNLYQWTPRFDAQSSCSCKVNQHFGSFNSMLCKIFLWNLARGLYFFLADMLFMLLTFDKVLWRQAMGSKKRSWTTNKLIFFVCTCCA